MLQAIARLALTAPRRIIGIALLVMAVSAIIGIPVTKSLSPGGFRDQTAESWRAAQVLSGKFGQGDMRLIIAVTSDAGVHSQAADAAGAQLVALGHQRIWPIAAALMAPITRRTGCLRTPRTQTRT
jgi:RND superfamily putative drug exporter